MRPLLPFLLFAALFSLAWSLPIELSPDLSSSLVAYYRFTEIPVRNGTMNDSSPNALHGTYPTPSYIFQVKWALGGDLKNAGLRFGFNSLRNSTFLFPPFRPSNALSLSFFVAAENSTGETFLLRLSSSSSPTLLPSLAQLSWSASRLVISSSLLSEPVYSQPYFLPGMLVHVLLSLQPGKLLLVVDGFLQADIPFPVSWADVGIVQIKLGVDPDHVKSPFLGTFDELLIFQRAFTLAEAQNLFDDLLHASLPSCSHGISMWENFGSYGNNVTIEGKGTENTGACLWGTTWVTKDGKVDNNTLVFDSRGSNPFASRYTSVMDHVSTLSLTARIQDLCGIKIPEEPMYDTVGYCHKEGKIILLNLCSFDNYCLSLGVSTAAQQIIYRAGLYSSPLIFADSVPRPLFTGYPSGMYLRIEVDEKLKVSFFYGPSLSTLTRVQGTSSIFYPNVWSLNYLNILRLVTTSYSQEPGAVFDDLHIVVIPQDNSPLYCDQGEYLSEKLCRPCPEGSTSPLGSTSRAACVCEAGLYLDACDGSADCEAYFEAGGFDFTGFRDIEDILTEGSASLLDNLIQLTPSKASQVGQLFYPKPFPLFSPFTPDTPEISFSTHFLFVIDSNGGPLAFNDADGAGADGMALVITSSLPPTAGGGGSLGYEGITPSVVIELDTYRNSNIGDESGNHVGISLNGNPRSVSQKFVSPRFNEGVPWHCWVEYDAAHTVLEVRLSTSAQRPADPDLALHESVAHLLGSSIFYIGFTAATGAQFSRHLLLSWDLQIASQFQCVSCPYDTYKSEVGNGFCPLCPYGSASEEGSTSLEQCLCYPGFEPSRNASAPATCDLCEENKFSSDYDSLCQPCPPHSSTYGMVGSSWCFCDYGYYEAENGTCVDINECEDWAIECLHNGTCHNEDGTYECICPPGWTGDLCERDINECNYLPCWNDGSCQNTLGSFVCHCPAGWQGQHCEVDVNECLLSPSPCDLSASCQNTIGSFVCSCLPGLIGSGLECHTPVGPRLITPGPSEVFGRYVLLRWIAEEYFGALLYTAQISLEPSFDFEKPLTRISLGSVTQMILNDLPPFTKMRVRLIASNAYGDSPASPYVEFKTTPASPEAAFLRYEQGARPVLSWIPGNTNGASISGFQIQLYRNDTLNTTITETVANDVSYLDLYDIIPHNVHHLAVVTTLSPTYGNSNPSNIISVVVKDEQPTVKPTSGPTPSTEPEPNKGSNVGAIVGSLIGVLCLVALAAAIAYYVIKVRPSSKGAIRLTDDDEEKARRKKEREERRAGKAAGKKDKEEELAEASLLSPTQAEGDVNVEEAFNDDDVQEIDDLN